jgi:hypothetical protein
MATIPLTDGGVVLVDDEDVERLQGRKWRRSKGYPCTGGRGRGIVYLHRVVMRAPIGTDVDHINGDLCDARKGNLRYCTDSQNQANRRKLCGKVPIKGVCVHTQTGKYQAQVKLMGRNHYLGLYDDPEEAGRAYLKKARELFGEFAWSNVREPEAA